ncbi:MAG TPA: ChbG/HpnK family deacetylase [Myxococcota bacterium]|nr:ChbG/HpnK family deacetylase [Myxococcota bacterium]
MAGRLLVTGDDLGASSAVNASIVRCHREGILTSASLMVAEPAAGEAVTLISEFPGLGTGLHIVLCDGAAASPPRAIPDLADSKGQLPSSALRAGLRDWVHRRRLRGQLEYEVRTQFERYAKTGLPFDHVDGHHHLHMHPVVFEIVQRCMEEHRVPCVRLMRESRAARPPNGSPTEELVPAIFSALARHHRRRLRRSGQIRTADEVWGLRATGRLDTALLCRMVRRMRVHTLELFTHPREDTEQGRLEEQALCAPEVRQMIADAGYELVSTRTLGREALG